MQNCRWHRNRRKEGCGYRQGCSDVSRGASPFQAPQQGCSSRLKSCQPTAPNLNDSSHFLPHLFSRAFDYHHPTATHHNSQHVVSRWDYPLRYRLQPWHPCPRLGLRVRTVISIPPSSAHPVSLDPRPRRPRVLVLVHVLALPRSPSLPP